LFVIQNILSTMRLLDVRIEVWSENHQVLTFRTKAKIVKHSDITSDFIVSRLKQKTERHKLRSASSWYISKNKYQWKLRLNPILLFALIFCVM